MIVREMCDLRSKIRLTHIVKRSCVKSMLHLALIKVKPRDLHCQYFRMLPLNVYRNEHKLLFVMSNKR